MMDRKAAHAALDLVLDTMARAAEANAPDAMLKAEGEAHAEWQRFAIAIAGAMLARRHGAAWFGIRPDDPDAALPLVLERGFSPVPSETMRAPELALCARQVLARFLMDSERLLPPGMANNAASALLLLNLGEEARSAWLTKPYRDRGAPKARGRKVFAEIAILSRIYYRAGFEGTGLELAARAEIAAIDNPGATKWEQLESVRKRHRLAEKMEEYRQKGAEDKEQGRPYHPLIGADYSVQEISRLPDI